MCDFSGRIHEFFLVMEKAGFNDEMIINIINAEKNILAKAMLRAYRKTLREENFELVKSISFWVTKASGGELVATMREFFYHNDWGVESWSNLTEKTDNLSQGKKNALMYLVKFPTSAETVREFIRRNGQFPGISGLSHVWLQQLDRQNLDVFAKRRVYGFSDDPNSNSKRVAVVSKLSSGLSEDNFYFEFRPEEKQIPAGSLIMIIKDADEFPVDNGNDDGKFLSTE